MSIIIQNIGGDMNGICNYELRINKKVVARFQHDRNDDLATCLCKAAGAADQQRKLQVIEMYFKMFRELNET